MNISLLLLFIPCLVMLAIAGVIWLFFCNGLDKLKNPAEWKDKGSSGERAVWITLTKQFNVPENQILRNVYIPTKNGTTEIDLVVVSQKGILIFECKNYSGNIYGDGDRKKWIQYIGKKKIYFLNPLLQNRGHVKHMREYLNDIENLPIIPFFVTTNNATWKLKNIHPEDNVLSWTGRHFADIYKNLPDSEVVAENYKKILAELRKLECPDESVRQAHIEQLSKIKNQ